MKLNKYAREVFSGKGGMNRFFSSLDSDIQELHRRVDSTLRYKSFTVTTIISDSGTTIHHHLGKQPISVRVLPKADARVWETARNTKTVTLKASAPVECEVEVRG